MTGWRRRGETLFGGGGDGRGPGYSCCVYSYHTLFEHLCGDAEGEALMGTWNGVSW